MPPVPRLTRGPLPPQVYWRRRLLVGGTALALLVILVSLVRGGGSSSDAGTDGAAQESSSQTTPAPTTSSGPTGTVQPGSGKGHHNGAKKARQLAKQQGQTGQGTQAPVATGPTQGVARPTLAAPTGTCRDGDVVVTPTVEPSVVGSPVTITLGLYTTSEAACTWKLSYLHLALKISRAGQEVWSSRDCPQQVPSQSVVVRSAVTTVTRVTWDGRLSSVGCPRTSPYVRPGPFHVSAASIGGPPHTSAFSMEQRTVVAPTTPTKPKKPTKPTGTATSTPSSTPSDTPSSTPTGRPMSGASTAPPATD